MGLAYQTLTCKLMFLLIHYNVTDKSCAWIRDIVDHTPWNGNVWKQLLGAINSWYDDDPG